MASATDVDLLVIGAGIHGAAVAREATAQGYRVAVLEQFSQPAQGTSCKSSKLIHGGVRYLESGQFSLVRECLREQAVLLHTAPHLTQAQHFHIPVASGMRRSSVLIQLGLYLYAALGGRWPQHLRARELHEPNLRTGTVRGALRYGDVQTDDALMTRAVLCSAELMGAQLHYRAPVSAIQNEIDCVRVTFQSVDTPQTLRATVVANCSGPWVNQVLACVQPGVAPAQIDLVKGTHIELPEAPAEGAWYCEAEDGRAVFVLPWKGGRLVGTTEVAFSGDPAQAAPTETEIDYLLRTHDRWFAHGFTRADVRAAWAGVRVLPKGESSAFSRPREAQFLCDTRAPRVWSLLGGKLTSHRATAEKFLTEMAPLLPPRVRRFDTRLQRLPIVDGETVAQHFGAR